MHASPSISKAVVTGHSRGLGAAIARQLLERGIAVLGVARRPHAGLAAQYGAQLAQVELDLSDVPRTAQWLAGGELARFLDGASQVLLVNNAGRVGPAGKLDVVDMGGIAQTVSVNVTAPLMLSAAFAAATTGASDRRIVHVSSGAGRHVLPGASLYCATKAALDHHARSVAADGDPTLRICSLAPGVIDTDMQTEIRSTSLERMPMREKFDALKRDGLLDTPEHAARKLVGYLLNEAFGQAPVADTREVVAPQ
ncbi:MAG: SDR family oxidoreductase [Pararobbsia sp.]